MRVVYTALAALLLTSCASEKNWSSLSSAKQEQRIIPRATVGPELRDISVRSVADKPAGRKTPGAALLTPILPSSTGAQLHAAGTTSESLRLSQARQAGERSASLRSRLEVSYMPPQVLLAPKKASNDSVLLAVESRKIGEGPTLTGLDVLKAENFARLRGKRVALLTNHSAIDREGRHILDLMVRNPNVQLVTLFSPEHGLYGNVDTKTPDTMDTATGLMVHSLYSSRKDSKTPPNHPRPEDLKGLDVVVVDMQDIGARFYTYCSYMGYMMEECAKLGIEVMVLDRPNPIGGLYVDGPLTDDDLLGHVTSYFKMPIAHGMTMGEMARMFNTEKRIDCKLSVVRVKGWTRDMYFDQTGLRWVNPSPNIQDLDAALVYPGIAITEAIVSMGRGTTEPFHLFGTPYLENPQEMCDAVNSAGLEGMRLEVTDFTPTGTLSRGHVGEGKLVKGARIIITDRAKFRPVALGVHVMNYLQGKYGPRMVAGRSGSYAPQYDVMVLRGACSAVLCAEIRERKPLTTMFNYIDQQVAAFAPIRAKYLLYPASQHKPTARASQAQ